MKDKGIHTKNGPLRLFMTMFQAGLIGFGGGNALIPVLYQKTVEEEGLLADEQYEEDVLVASITPGALPVEIAGGIGHRLLGWKGTLIGAYGMALPGVILTLAFLALFKLLNEEVFEQIGYISVGVYAFICVLLFGYVKGTFANRPSCAEGIREGRQYRYELAVSAVVFALTCGKNLYRILGSTQTPIFGLATIDIFILAFFVIFTNAGRKNAFRNTVSVLLCILYIALKGKGIPLQSAVGIDVLYVFMTVMAATGLAASLKNKRKAAGGGGKRERIKDIAALAAPVCVFLIPAFFITADSAAFAGKGILSSVISFGGGDAYLTVADGMFVSSGLVSESVFYGNIVPVVNILPGSILCKTLSGVGFSIGSEAAGTVIGGLLTAALGFSASVFASCGIFSLIHICYGAVSDVPAFMTLKTWIRPIVSGLMFTVILSLIYQVKQMGEGIAGWGYVGIMAALFAAASVLSGRKSNMAIIGILAAGSLVICNLFKMAVLGR